MGCAIFNSLAGSCRLRSSTHHSAQGRTIAQSGGDSEARQARQSIHPHSNFSWSKSVQKRLSALIAVVGVGVALTGCSNHQAAAAPEPTEVLVTSVVQRDVPIYREWVAQLNGSVNAQISPRVSGYIIKRNFQGGFLFPKGQTQFEIY